MSDISKCPAMGGPQQHIAASTSANQRWWPNQLNLKVLNQNAPQVSPMNDTFNYVEEFKSVDLEELRKDIEEVKKEGEITAQTAPTARPDRSPNPVHLLPSRPT